MVAQKLIGHLLQEIVARGASGGPLFPLASQLNDDVTHLQGQRLEVALLAGQMMALAEAGGGAEAPRKPVRLPPRPPPSSAPRA